jgi:hypothetical protein
MAKMQRPDDSSSSMDGPPLGQEDPSQGYRILNRIYSNSPP